MTALLARVPWNTWKPKLLDCLPGYNRRTFVSDLIAGLTVGVVAVPLAMAFGIASGVTPRAGIYTAIVGGFIVSLLGGSRIQIAGPTGAFVVIVAGIIARHGLSGLLMVTMMAGVILIFLALTGLGQAVKFIPRPVVLGFTNGIALLIASTQIKDFLGLRTAEMPSEFFSRMAVLAASIDTVSVAALGLAVVSLALVTLVQDGSRACLDQSWPSSWARPRSRSSRCRSKRLDRSSAASRGACRTSRSRGSAPI